MEARPYNEPYLMDVADHADIEHEPSIDVRLSRLEQAFALSNHIKRLEARIGAMRSEMLELLEGGK